MEEKFTFFWSGPFSQWHPSKFSIEKITYSCAEQWMMAAKARLFNDNDALKKIMKTNNPKEQKAFGRKVKGYADKIWDKFARNFVYIGSLAKYSQNNNLKKRLMETRGTTLVEASPLDTKWGIGLNKNDPRAQKRENWLGTNWLGEVLTQLRDDFFEDKVNTKRFL